MSLSRPLFLLALAALPVLWLLSRAVWTRREVVVASLLIWRRLGLGEEPPRETRRRSDRLLLLRLSAAAALALGLAGPNLVGDEPPSVLYVLVDESPSMGAFGERTAEALDAIRAAAGDARVEVLRASGVRDLSAALALAGEGDVVVITDHPPEGIEAGGRVRIVLVGEPVANVGIVSAWIEPAESGFRRAAVVRSFRSAPATVRVRSGGREEEIGLPPGGSRLVSWTGQERRVEIAVLPGDRFVFDDRVLVEWEQARPIRVRLAGRADPRVVLALEIGGAERGASADLAIVVAPPGETRPTRPGTVVAAPALAPEAAPSPTTPLGPASVLPPGGDVLLADADGPLVVLRGAQIEVALDPADAASGWAEDPAFPIFWAEVARLLGARPARSVVVEGTIDPEESATRTLSAPWRLGDVRPSPAREVEAADLSPVLFLTAAAALLLHLVLEGRRRRALGSE